MFPGKSCIIKHFPLPKFNSPQDEQNNAFVYSCLGLVQFMFNQGIPKAFIISARALKSLVRVQSLRILTL